MEEHSPTQLASPAFDALRCPSDTLLYIVGASYGKLLMVPLVRTLGDRCGVELVVQLDVELLGTLLGHLLRHVHLSVELLWLEGKHML